MKLSRRELYFLIGCIFLSILIIGSTYAYFTANSSDADTIKGDAATVSFGLSVEKITDIDMAFGLIPMRNNQAPKAALAKCRDDYGNAACQMYRVTATADSETVMFLDGYILMDNKEGVETRISRIYTDDNEESFYTKFSELDFLDDEFNEDDVIQTGIKVSENIFSLSHDADKNCLFLENEKIGGDAGVTRDFYMMVWVYDNGESQDYLQGMELAYQGTVVFQTAEGNEISATFD